jgi:hypothetical protein
MLWGIVALSYSIVNHAWNKYTSTNMEQLLYSLPAQIFSSTYGSGAYGSSTYNGSTTTAPATGTTTTTTPAATATTPATTTTPGSATTTTTPATTATTATPATTTTPHGGLSGWGVTLIVIGSLIVLGALLWLLLAWLKRRKKDQTPPSVGPTTIAPTQPPTGPLVQ